MKARGLPQDGIDLQVLESLQEIIWSKIASGVKISITTFIGNLLEEQLATVVGADCYEGSQKYKAYRNGQYQRKLLSKYRLINIYRKKGTLVQKLRREITEEYRDFHCDLLITGKPNPKILQQP